MLCAASCDLFSARLPCGGTQDCQGGALCTDGFCALPPADGGGGDEDAGAQDEDAGFADAGTTDAGGALDAGGLLDAGGGLDAGAVDAGDAGAGVLDGGLRGPIIRYTFAEGAGLVLRDVADAGAAVDLTLLAGAPVVWLDGGISFSGASRATSAAAPAKLISACAASNELTVEAWVKPASASQAPGGAPARVVTLSVDNNTRDFMFGQQADAWMFRVRTTDTNNNGNLLVDGGSRFAQTGAIVTTNLAHVVWTRGATGVMRGWVDGVRVVDEVWLGTFSNWDAAFLLAIGNELDTDGGTPLARPWLGELHELSLYCRALQDAEVATRFTIGPR